MSMKSYSRYEPDRVLGCITSPNCNIVFDWSGNLAISGCCQSVNIFNVRQGSLISSVQPDKSPSYPFDFRATGAAEVIVLAVSPDKHHVAAGYSTGEIRLIDYNKNIITVYNIYIIRTT